MGAGTKRRISVLGVVGAIASGKSTVSCLLARCGAAVVDADRIAHQVLEMPGIRKAVRGAFGERVIGTGDSVCRSALAEEVFADAQKLKRLNEIVHPLIIERIRADIEEIQQQGEAAVVVLDAALLMETGLDKELCDALLFVEADPGVRTERARAQRGWSREQLHQRERCQIGEEVKKKQADFVIDNSGTRAHLERCVQAEWEKILRYFSKSPYRAEGQLR